LTGPFSITPPEHEIRKIFRSGYVAGIHLLHASKRDRHPPRTPNAASQLGVEGNRQCIVPTVETPSIDILAVPEKREQDGAKRGVTVHVGIALIE
jgi:hypothetical protein